MSSSFQLLLLRHLTFLGQPVYPKIGQGHVTSKNVHVSYTKFFRDFIFDLK